MIPKIIHYCWFGGNEMPEQLKKCLKSWEILKKHGYKIMCWNESNCSLDENEFVRKAYSEKRWGFIGDYYRAKALYEWGGIYLDTDVMVHQTFDDLLEDHAFIGYSCDVALCTAVVGSEKCGEFIKGILDMYDDGNFITEDTFFKRNDGENPYHTGNWAPSNEFWTWYVLKNYKGCSLNNKEQTFSSLHIYPKQYFELGSLLGSYYSRHLNYNSWHEKKGGYVFLRKIKRNIEENTVCWIVIRRIVNKRGQKNTSFYRCRSAILNAYSDDI